MFPAHDECSDRTELTAAGKVRGDERERHCRGGMEGRLLSSDLKNAGASCAQAQRRLLPTGSMSAKAKSGRTWCVLETARSLRGLDTASRVGDFVEDVIPEQKPRGSVVIGSEDKGGSRHQGCKWAEGSLGGHGRCEQVHLAKARVGVTGTSPVERPDCPWVKASPPSL